MLLQNYTKYFKRKFITLKLSTINVPQKKRENIKMCIYIYSKCFLNMKKILKHCLDR